MPIKTRNILILAIILIIIVVVFGLSAYFIWKLSQSKELTKPVGTVISSTQNMGPGLTVLASPLARLLPSDFAKHPFQILQNEKRYLSDGSIQYVFGYSSNMDLNHAYAQFRNNLINQDATFETDHLLKNNFVLKAQVKGIKYNIAGYPGHEGSWITISSISVPIQK